MGVTGSLSPGHGGEARDGDMADTWERPESLWRLQSWVKWCQHENADRKGPKAKTEGEGRHGD